MTLKKLHQVLPLLLAGLLQTMPLLRTALPAMQSAAGPAWAYIFPWVAGGLAYFGYDAIASASSISISPATATNGVFYSGIITYSGGHAGSVNSFSLSNNIYGGTYGSCLASGSLTLAPGLTITYNGGNTATVSGTPNVPLTTAYTNVFFRVIAYQAGGCSTSSHVDAARTTSLIISPPGGIPTAPTIAVQPQNNVAQVGSTVILSGGAAGNPPPAYFWKQGINFIPGATNNTLVLNNVQLTNAGIYTLVASNSVASTPAACYLSVCQTPGTNILLLDYTNYAPAGTAVTMTSVLTNVPAATTSYSWDYNLTPIGVTTPNLTLSAAQVTPARSGVYSVFFSSTNSGVGIVSGVEYDSYWTFGYVPGLTNNPASVSTNSGATVTLMAAVTGTAPTVMWYQNGTNLVASQTLGFNPANAAANLIATNATLKLTNVTSATAGTYAVVVTNNWGSITSAPALVTVAPSLAVTTPAGVTNYAGNAITLTATATGSGSLNYQWLKGSSPVFNRSSISGATTTNLTIFPALVSDSGTYAIVVTNLSGSVTSGVANVSLVPAPGVAAGFSGGQFSLSATGGIASRKYVVQTTTNLATPVWLPLITNQAAGNGTIFFTDTNPATGQRYYQLQLP